VIAAGFSAGMSVKAQKPIPLLHFPHAWNLRLPKPLEFDGEALVYGFAGLLGVGPIIQGLQFLRFGRRRWSAVEWAWTAAGTCFAALPVLDEWLPFRWDAPVEQVFDLFVVLFYWGTGPVALMCVLPSIFRHRNLPWSGWMGLLVTVSWSVLWWVALFF
jgi:hypothetical protein